MTVGTKSVLFGFHQLLLHPLFVAAAWARLYGFPVDPRLWTAFAVHDLGYIGKRKMDDDVGETHPKLGARIMSVFGAEWHDFVLLHSRFYAARLGRRPSRLCVADKLSICLYPRWLWKLLVCASGEVDEYLVLPKYAAVGQGGFTRAQLDEKHAAMRAELSKWVMENK